MTTEPLPVQPVRVEYYPDKDVGIIRVMQFIAIISIVVGTLHILKTAVDITGTILGMRFRNAGTWNLILGFAPGCLSTMLVPSAIGCLRLKPMARRGMLLYGVVAIASEFVTTGSAIWPMLRAGEAPPLDITVSYLAWLAGGCILPAIVLMVFRLHEVRRAFEP